MGQVCSCGRGNPGEAEAVSKPASPAQIPAVTAHQQNGIAATGASPGAGTPAAPAAGAGPPKASVEAMKALVKQAAHASRGDVAALAEESESEEEDWHDALDVPVEELLAKWDDDQAATLQRLDRLMELMEAKGLTELAAAPPAPAEEGEPGAERRRRYEELRPSSSSGAAAVAGASASALEAAPAAVVGKLRSGLDAIFKTMHAPAHGSRAEALAAQARTLAAEGRVLAAHRTLQELATEAGSTMAELAEHAEILGVDVVKVEREAAEVEAVLADLANDEGWMVSRDDTLRVLYKHEKGGTGHSLKFRVILDHPAEHILAMANEFDLIKTWNKFSTDSLKVWQESIFEAIVYGAQWMPRPFKQFYALVHARGFDLAEERQSLLVLLEDASLGSLPPGAAPLPPTTAKRRCCNVRKGSCINLRPLAAGPGGRPRTECFLMTHIDPHIPMVPAWLLNFVLGVLAPYIFAQIQQVLTTCFADREGLYPSRIRAQPELYGHMRRRLREYNTQYGLGYSEGEEEGGADGGGGAGAGAGAAQQESVGTSPGAGARTAPAAAAPAVAAANGGLHGGPSSAGGGGGSGTVPKLGEALPVEAFQASVMHSARRLWDTFNSDDFHDAMSDVELPSPLVTPR